MWTARGSACGLLHGRVGLRAAAFEHRLAAVIAVDGVYSVFQSYYNALPPEMRKLYETGNFELINQAVAQALIVDGAPTGARWGVEQGMWSFALKGTPLSHGEDEGNNDLIPFY
ncbi:hypothetical protein V1520DRAFT_344206 [Lipomyces starkeyi]|uniref:Uncharacterized protein n=1 Tax=Lipomyces starkeyi NRRL Y-11557 TaxID=675824 RepID=A0A1E3Q981_LIPST|nr:hypothetical protein LIPSTDRAFT_2060 [Lipomyces starkeyi NRRL Y-11557]